MNDVGNWTEEIVQLHVRERPVYGIVHDPAPLGSASTSPGVVFINAGIRSRRGPNRLYVRFARRLCREGFVALRFDPPGLGDSPGAFPTVGGNLRRFIDCTESAIRAIDYLQQRRRVGPIGLISVCGGAYSAVTISAIEPRVRFMVLGALPVQELGDLTETASHDVTMHAYLRKAFQWRSWYRFLSGKSRYRWFAQAILRLMRDGYSRPELDRALWQAFEKFVASGRPALCVYGSRDPFHRAFDEGYRPRLCRMNDSSCAIHVVEGSNHDFSQQQWQNELIEVTLDWLRKRFPADSEPPGTCAAGPEPRLTG